MTLDELLTQRALQRLAIADARSARQSERRNAHAQRRAGAIVADDCWQGWFDGSALPNPGRMGLGVVLRAPTGVLSQYSVEGGYGDSNQAEYMALIALLEAAREHEVPKLVIYGDSRVVLDDLDAAVGIPVLLFYRQRANDLMKAIPEIECRWIPRARNQLADALAQRARQPT